MSNKKTPCKNEYCDNLANHTSKSGLCRGCYDEFDSKRRNDIKQVRLATLNSSTYIRHCSSYDCSNKIVYKSHRSHHRAEKAFNDGKTSGLCNVCKTRLAFKENPKLGQEISERRKNNIGWRHKPETIKKMKESCVRGKSHKWFGKTYSEEEKKAKRKQSQEFWKAAPDDFKKNCAIKISNKLKIIHEEKIGSDVNYKTRLAEKEYYYKEVRRFTKRQSLRLLKNYEKRGRSGIKGAYHLDHLYSIKMGFDNAIPAEIIGHISNLSFIKWEVNTKKSVGCIKTIEELLSDIVLYDTRPGIY